MKLHLLQNRFWLYFFLQEQSSSLLRLSRRSGSRQVQNVRKEPTTRPNNETAIASRKQAQKRRRCKCNMKQLMGCNAAKANDPLLQESFDLLPLGHRGLLTASGLSLSQVSSTKKDETTETDQLQLRRRSTSMIPTHPNNEAAIKDVQAQLQRRSTLCTKPLMDYNAKDCGKRFEVKYI